MMDLDTVNKEFYNAYADSFDKIPFKDVLPNLLLKYLSQPDSQVLEIGSGAGALALWMTQLGHTITCIEPAEIPAEMARKKGLTVCTTRFQDFQTDQKFDFILAISSLIHIPQQEIPDQIKKLSKLLQKEGLAIVSLIEGDSEGYDDPTKKGKNRYFSKFSEQELKSLLSPYFSIIERHKIEVRQMNQSFLLLVLKPIERIQ